MNRHHDTRVAWPGAMRPALVPMLSPREHLVLVGMSHGLTNAGIGQHLNASESTIKTHARKLFRKLGATDRAHATRIGFEWGLLWDHQPREPDPVVGWVTPHIRPRSVTDNGCVGMLLQAVETAAADGHWNGMTEVERWRWSPVVMRAKQVVRKLDQGRGSVTSP